MSSPVARLGDTSTHGGVIVTASLDVTVNSIGVARVTDLHDCPVPGHGITPIMTGSPVAQANGLVVAIIGSVTGCGAVISSGSPNVTA